MELGWLDQHDEWQYGKHIACSAELQWREIMQSQFHRHEVGTPDHNNAKGGGQVAATQVSLMHSAGVLKR